MELPEPLEFMWDIHNIDKNFFSHSVTNEEIEEAFEDRYKKLNGDAEHSVRENRSRLLGKTKAGRLLYIVFTIRKNLVRPISARDINRKEVPFYEKTT